MRLLCSCTEQKESVTITSAEDLIHECLSHDPDNYAVSMYMSQASSYDNAEKEMIQTNLSFLHFEQLSKGSITEATTANKTTDQGNRSGNSTRRYDQYREYQNGFVSVYSKNETDTEWKQEEVISPLDIRSIENIMAKDLDWYDLLEKEDTWQCSAKFSNFMDLFFTVDQNNLDTYTEHQEVIDALLKDADIRFIFAKEDYRLLRIEMDDIHWYDPKDVKNSNFTYSLHIDISDYGSVERKDVDRPLELKA